MSGLNNTLVLGIGNELLCDDGIGLRVVDCAARMLSATCACVTFKTAYSAGIDLLYDMMNVSHAIVVDAVCTGRALPGFCHEFSVDDIQHMTQSRLADSHGVDLPTVLMVGKRMGYSMPSDIVVLGIETEDVTSFSTELTSAVNKAVPTVVERIRMTLMKWEAQTPPKSNEGGPIAMCFLHGKSP